MTNAKKEVKKHETHPISKAAKLPEEAKIKNGKAATEVEDEFERINKEMAERLQYEEFQKDLESAKDPFDMPPAPEYKTEQLIPDRPHYMHKPVKKEAKVPGKTRAIAKE